MAKPPTTPPTKDSDSERHDADARSAGKAAEQTEHARAGSKGRPPQSKS